MPEVTASTSASAPTAHCSHDEVRDLVAEKSGERGAERAAAEKGGGGEPSSLTSPSSLPPMADSEEAEDAANEWVALVVGAVAVALVTVIEGDEGGVGGGGVKGPGMNTGAGEGRRLKRAAALLALCTRASSSPLKRRPFQGTAPPEGGTEGPPITGATQSEGSWRNNSVRRLFCAPV